VSLFPQPQKRQGAGMSLDRTFTTASNAVAHAAGAPTTFLICCIVEIVWAASGPFFGFSDTWQLVINTGTTIVTFLMVFLIQNTQNRDGAAIQAKLDELVRASASQNAFIGIEHLTQAEVEEFRVKCAERAAGAAAGDQAVLQADKEAKAAAESRRT
jgi:low affinity Fe/Cu permease